MDRAPLSVLLVDPDEAMQRIERLLEHADDSIQTKTITAVDALGEVESTPDVAVVYHDTDDGIDGIRQSALVRLHRPELPVVVVARDIHTDFIVEVFDNDVADVICLDSSDDDELRIPALVARRIRYAAGAGGEFASEDQLLDSLMEYLPHQVFIKDDQGRIVETSASAAEEYGLEREQMIGLTDRELFFPVYADSLWEEEAEIMVTEEPIVNRTERYTDDQGREHWVNVTKAPRYNSDGDVVGIIGTAVDVSERKRQEEMMNALHTASRDLVGAESRTEIAEIVVEIAENVPDLPAVEVALAKDGDLQPVCTTREVDPPSVFDEYEPWFVRAFETGERQFLRDRSDDPTSQIRSTSDRAETESFGTNGTVLPLGEHGVLAFSAGSGTFDEFGIELADVLAVNVETAFDRMQHEEALRARERELARQNQRLEEFTGIVSHDLRNPLSVAQGYLPATDVDDSIKDEIQWALERMDRLTDELLTLARQGEIVGETDSVSLHEVSQIAWNSVSNGDATLSLDEDVTIEADRERLIELLENLFRNSVEHGSNNQDSHHAGKEAIEQHRSPDNPITVTVGSLTNGFYVEDDGHGIPPEQRSVVFEQGFSGGDGTGFGLYIVETLAEAHEWEVSITDAHHAPTGARFEITCSDQ